MKYYRKHIYTWKQLMNCKSFLYIIMGLLVLAVISLIIYITVASFECTRLHYDDNLRLWGSRDAVPDEETAKKIAVIVVERQMRYLNMGYQLANRDYNHEISFNKVENQWELYLSPIPPEGTAYLGAEIMVSIRKDCGMITGLVFLP